MIASTWKWIAATLLVAGLVHVASLLLLPQFVMMRAMAVITGPSGATNTMRYPPRANADSHEVVRPSPDLLYSVCVYDLDAADGALLVSTYGMPETYWSVSAFDADTNNFYVLNDRQAKSGAVRFVLMPPGSAAVTRLLPTLESPTNRGIVLFRTLVEDEAHLAAIDTARHHALCEPYSAALSSPPE